MYRLLAMCLTVAALVAVVAPHAQAQDERTARNTVYMDLGGNALIYSLNYERILPGDVGLRAGFSYMSVSATAGTAGADASIIGIPVTASYLGIGGATKLELGGGATFMKFSGASSTGFGEDIEVGVFVPMATGIAGLRISPPGGGFNFRLAFTPMWHPDVGFFPWGGASFGFGF